MSTTIWGALMADLSVDTTAVRTFAAAQDGVAADIAGAGGLDTVSHVAAMTPVFGLIGADFLASFAVAELLHDKDINALSGRFAKIGQAAFGSAGAYESTDGDFAAGLGAAAGGLGEFA
ncbi:ESX-1 secretion-associated protein [Nocardia yamanashiensis]|uniref:type VII secretion target n=1 Tax=Nocardia yamanashiensis TaxID=209247 RepID=UPI001E3C3FBD|nr:type VII secretion target [Nocardia yamanashiensis]UGT43018.1 ESX-1 secretion-associated protein [Nocardia yamanashiensis]